VKITAYILLILAGSFLISCASKPIVDVEQVGAARKCVQNSENQKIVHKFFDLDIYENFRADYRLSIPDEHIRRKMVKRDQDVIFIKTIPRLKAFASNFVYTDTYGLYRLNTQTNESVLISDIPMWAVGGPARSGDIIWYGGTTLSYQFSDLTGLVLTNRRAGGQSFIQQLKYDAQTDTYLPFEDERIRKIRALVKTDKLTKLNRWFGLVAAGENGHLILASAKPNEIFIVDEEGDMIRFPVKRSPSTGRLYESIVHRSKFIFTGYIGLGETRARTLVEVDYGEAFSKKDTSLIKMKQVNPQTVFCPSN